MNKTSQPTRTYRVTALIAEDPDAQTGIVTLTDPRIYTHPEVASDRAFAWLNRSGYIIGTRVTDVTDEGAEELVDAYSRNPPMLARTLTYAAA